MSRLGKINNNSFKKKALSLLQSFYSVSCSQDGILWAVTCQGQVLERTGITSKTPTGKPAFEYVYSKLFVTNKDELKAKTGRLLILFWTQNSLKFRVIYVFSTRSM